MLLFITINYLQIIYIVNIFYILSGCYGGNTNIGPQLANQIQYCLYKCNNILIRRFQIRRFQQRQCKKNVMGPKLNFRPTPANNQ